MNRAGYSVVLYLICCIYGRLASRKNPHSFNSPFHPERSNISRKLLVEESVDVAGLGFLIFRSLEWHHVTSLLRTDRIEAVSFPPYSISFMN